MIGQMAIHAQEGQDKRLAGAIAMTLLLTTLGMLFASLFMGLAVFRTNSDTWPPMGLPRVPWMFPALSTLCIAASSWCYWRLEKTLRPLAWWGALAFGALFMLSQCLVWKQMHGMGLYASSGIFASLIYAFTWIHAGHIAVGLLALAWAYPRRAGIPQSRLSNIGKFWHFLSVTWFLIYLALFVF